MSWDVVIFNAPADATSLDDLPQNYDPPALGPANDVRQRLREAFEAIDLSDPAWGYLAGPTWGIEFNIGTEDPVLSVMLHVGGSGDDVLPVIAQVVAAVGGRPLDCTTSEFLTGDPTQTAGWHGFQAYRDRVFGSD